MNIRQVAEQARVSTATVSRVLNGTAPVSEKITERVQAAIKKLNFYPNTHARTLGSGKSRMYGLIISDITNPFFSELVKEFENIAVAHGLEVVVGNTDYNLERMETCVRRMLERKVDGVAIMTSEMAPGLGDIFSQRGIPIVFLDNGRVGLRSSNIQLDFDGAVDLAIQHLSLLGHTRIAFISGPDELKSAQMRYQAFRNSMRQQKLPFVASLVRPGGGRPAGGRTAMLELLQLPSPPTAVLAVNDVTAVGAISAIFQSGLRVPEDISVIGCDDTELSSFTHPPLTTIHVSRSDLATCAFMALFGVSQRGETGRAYKLDTTLVLRQSTAAARKKTTREKNR